MLRVVLERFVVVEVELADARWVLVVEGAHLGHVVERDAHGHVDLGRREGDAGDALGDRVLDLEARVELEEVVVARLHDVHVLDGAGRLVAERLAEVDGGLHHVDEDVIGDHQGRALLEDLLEAALGRAVTPAEGDRVDAVADDLHLNVTGACAQGDEEDGRARHLREHLRPRGAERRLIGGHADALATAALGRLEHDRVAHHLGRLDGIVFGGDARGVKVGLRDFVILVEVGTHAIAVPRHARDASVLGDERRADLVAEDTHHVRRRADECDVAPELRRALLEQVAQFGILRRVTPADHDGVDALADAQVDDELDVGVVVGVRAAGHLHKLVGAADELGVGGEVLWRGHHHKLNGPLVAKGVVGPVLDGHDRLGRGHAVVRDEDLADHFRAAARTHVRLHRSSEFGVGRSRLSSHRADGSKVRAPGGRDRKLHNRRAHRGHRDLRACDLRTRSERTEEA